MRRAGFLGTLFALAGAPVVSRASASGKDAADLIVTGAKIHTVDSAMPAAQAFSVRGGRFAYVGSVEGAMALRGPNTAIVDLSGSTVLPGLIDAHIHLTSVGMDLSQVDVFKLHSFEEVVARTVAFARTSPDPWILGDGWDQNLWPGKSFPTHEALSAALPDRPVALSRVDGHAVLANAKAMQIAGVDKRTPDPAGGRIVRDANGEPTGVFVDAAQGIIYGKVPEPTHDQLVRATRSAIAECNRYGLTTVAEPGTNDVHLAAHRTLLEAGDYSIRNYAMLSDNAELIDEHLRSGPIDAAYDGRLWVRAIKMFADGALGSRGAALLAPYSDDPSNVGLVVTPGAHMQEVAERALRAGFQVCVHAIGDRGNRIVLDAYEGALRAVPAADPRFRIEHAQVIALDDIPRFAKLGIIPSMQSTHQISDMAWAQARLGPDRIQGAYAWRRLLDTGVIIANGTDAPVEAVSTLRTFHAAVTRQNESNVPPGGWYPDQRMTREEALKSMTIWAAHANFQEKILGSITPGKYADFVVMDRDWLTVPPEEIMGTRIQSTYLSGKRAYDGTSTALAHRPRKRAGCCTRPATTSS
ncbi:MAG TPA: amidohydrolase [Candidatus Acidoferrales bacterium]|jgi:predicted amidohydrolase YtcJ|nr:amidohydrolase [Candidatus Acidoferrales bacterium]